MSRPVISCVAGQLHQAAELPPAAAALLGLRAAGLLVAPWSREPAATVDAGPASTDEGAER